MNNLIGLTKGQSALIDNDPWEIAEEPQYRKDGENTGHWILPLADWLEHCQQTDTYQGSQAQTGVLLDPEDDPEILAEGVGQIPLIALGEVLRDQLVHMRHCGFTSFAVRKDKSAADALKGLTGFDMIYSRSVTTPEPLFRRRGGAK